MDPQLLAILKAYVGERESGLALAQAWPFLSFIECVPNPEVVELSRWDSALRTISLVILQLLCETTIFELNVDRQKVGDLIGNDIEDLIYWSHCNVDTAYH